jgi:hypothetical protein
MLGSPQGSESSAPREKYEAVAQSYPDDVDDVPF